MTRLVLVLGDQLTERLSAIRNADKDRDVIVMAEAMEEATYVRHHAKKIAFIFSFNRLKFRNVISNSFNSFSSKFHILIVVSRHVTNLSIDSSFKTR